MAKIVRERKRIEEVSYDAVYKDTKHKGCGWAFPCDKNGHIALDSLEAPALRNLVTCIVSEENGGPIRYDGVRENITKYTEDAVAECDHCGCLVSLHGFTNTCDNCGADYNLSGQLLAGREQWGEETGETPGGDNRIGAQRSGAPEAVRETGLDRGSFLR